MLEHTFLWWCDWWFTTLIFLGAQLGLRFMLQHLKRPQYSPPCPYRLCHEVYCHNLEYVCSVNNFAKHVIILIILYKGYAGNWQVIRLVDHPIRSHVSKPLLTARTHFDMIFLQYISPLNTAYHIYCDFGLPCQCTTDPNVYGHGSVTMLVWLPNRYSKSRCK